LKVTHVITGLEAHGAEIMLYRFLAASNPRDYQYEVISLTDRGQLAEKIEGLGITVRALGMRPGVPNPLAMARLARMLRDSQPQVVQTWMYHANLIGGLAARLGGHIPVVWGIHHSRIDRREMKALTVLTAKMGAWLSRSLPTSIVSCSVAAEEAHVGLGYAREKMRVIPNGIDIDRFQADPVGGQALRRDLNIPGDAPVIGLAARFHPNKDHATFLRAAGILLKKMPKVHFVLCGDGIVAENAQMAAEIEAAGLNNHCHLLGPQSDMRRVYSAWDIAASSSVSEAFPLAVGEAMACEVPCVVTDVGDCAAIVGETGKVVPPQDPERMAASWQEFLGLGRETLRRLGARARERIATNYSLPALVERYQAIYESVGRASRDSQPAAVVEREASAASANAKSI
jgi:glycosyltransferase involved in cell wall biosynthesis